MFEKANEIKVLLEQKGVELQDFKAFVLTILTRSAHGVLNVCESRTIRFSNPAAEGIYDTKEKGLLGKQFKFPITSGETKVLIVRSRIGKTIDGMHFP